MSIAQELYEGIDLGSEGAEGSMTYMRTDALFPVPPREYIRKEFGAEYLPDQPRLFASKKSAQEAHEATPDEPASHARETRTLDFLDQFKTHQLIWRRLIASQMNPDPSEIHDQRRHRNFAK